ncbi:ABC transporter ATP-binding protein [Novipirellula artificiosorum]|uniref:Macrolide export ATP-binding/permease protein MacB n=1 Tax=Novipirellula artificiosorum TaxID=2528016 RepID=A0A5C6DXG8_9BACT|nr:ABC transporter ATP-binding protein [Novipirellula artificiosorum]TWU39726.1 Macrolide export ATP-binding/permease protein MacB [Novipirellula artificiosorum]
MTHDVSLGNISLGNAADPYPLGSSDGVFPELQTGESAHPVSAKQPTRKSVAAETKIVLSATQVRKSYNIGGEKRWVLNGVDFQAASGECVFLSGPSGSGKSTLLSILGCLLEADSGKVTIADRRVDTLSVAERTSVRRDNVGFVFQRFQLIRGLSAEDNVAVPLTLQGATLADARVQAGDLLGRVGLETHRKHLPTAMSPGQCQRVALARAVITSPKLLLADEPTAALDGKSGIEVMELLRELVGVTGSATIVVTHDPRISKYADRICEIENGRFK